MTESCKFDAEVQKYCRWHRWFAWYPVKIEFEGKHYKAWMEFVGRKQEVFRDYSEYGPSNAIGNPKYCFYEDLLFNKLKDDEIIDRR